MERASWSGDGARAGTGGGGERVSEVAGGMETDEASALAEFIWREVSLSLK